MLTGTIDDREPFQHSILWSPEYIFWESVELLKCSFYFTPICDLAPDSVPRCKPK